MIWGLCVALAAATGGDSPIRADEVVVLFPAAAHLDESRENWVCPVHGHIFEPERNSVKRAAALGALRRLWGLDAEGTESAIFGDYASCCRDTR